jgi:hypothetical protein
MPANGSIEPVSRIPFGKVVFCPLERGKWVFAHSTEPASDSRLSHHVLLEERNLQALERFHSSNASIDEGPYCDGRGLVRDLGRKLAERVSSDSELIVRAISLIRDSGVFAFDRSLVLDEGLFTAGSALSNAGRATRGARKLPIRFAHEMEPYLLVTALLRTSGMHAYPALAIAQPGLGEREPVMAVHQPAGPVPLKTFSLTGIHPPMCELEILGDLAAAGVCHSMMAENRAKRLGADILGGALAGSVYPEGEIERAVNGFSEELFLCHKHWPESPFIGKAIGRLGDEVEQSLCLAACGTFGSSRRMGLMAAWAGLLAEGLKDIARKTLEGLKAASAAN